MEFADFVEKCVKEYKETENEFAYQLIDPFCETVVEKTLSKKELKGILLKGMKESNLLDKVKQAREDIENIAWKSCSSKIVDGNRIKTELIDKEDVLVILDSLIAESES